MSDWIEILRTSGVVGFPLREQAMAHLSKLPNYNWCGVYRLEGDELVLDAYVGDSTEHTRIPVGVGVCGTAVAESRNQIIDDVRELTNYLACSTMTRSEIVVLIRKDDKILGQIDIDGHAVGAFGVEDEQMLEKLATLLADGWESSV
ncbi:MAG: GAF domain-containing protein [Armatimonadetes bacterium]|nr:GAF domain-containing protein [Armatimonadota bacterium]